MNKTMQKNDQEKKQPFHDGETGSRVKNKNQLLKVCISVKCFGADDAAKQIHHGIASIKQEVQWP